jgi:hypothetical protein
MIYLDIVMRTIDTTDTYLNILRYMIFIPGNAPAPQMYPAIGLFFVIINGLK